MSGQGMLFDAPTMDGQAPLFGETYEWAPDPGGPDLVPDDRNEPDELDELVPWNGAQVSAALVKAATDEAHLAKIRRQTEEYAHRSNEANDHRRQCDTCWQRGRCRESKRLDAETRTAANVLRKMRTGEL